MSTKILQTIRLLVEIAKAHPSILRLLLDPWDHRFPKWSHQSHAPSTFPGAHAWKWGGGGLVMVGLDGNWGRLHGKIEVMDGGWNNQMKQASSKQWWSSSKIFSKMCSSVVARVTSGCTKFYFFGWRSLKQTKGKLKAHWLPVWVVLPTEREDLSSLGTYTPYHLE